MGTLKTFQNECLTILAQTAIIALFLFRFMIDITYYLHCIQKQAFFRRARRTLPHIPHHRINIFVDQRRSC